MRTFLMPVAGLAVATSLLCTAFSTTNPVTELDAPADVKPFVNPREASVVFVDESRGGAAVRDEASPDVLFPDHYTGPAVTPVKNQSGLSDPAKTKTKLKPAASATKSKTARDRSAYADRSVYAAQKSTKDRSAYAPKK